MTLEYREMPEQQTCRHCGHGIERWASTQAWFHSRNGAVKCVHWLMSSTEATPKGSNG